MAATLATAPPAEAVGALSPDRALVVWAWERSEDLRFLPPGVEIAVQTGFVVLSSDQVLARGRRHALLAQPGQVTINVVHVQIDPVHPPLWTPAQRSKAAREVVRLAGNPRARRVQIDFEAPASRRTLVLDLTGDVRAKLPPDTGLSMTALASWCEGETWISQSKADEIVPMLFRMGAGGAAIRSRLNAGEDFATPRCRSALGVSTDTPIPRAPLGRRVYLFNPHSWTPSDFDRVRRSLRAWAEP